MFNSITIQTVKIQGEVYLLNGTIHVPKADGNAEYEAIKRWLAEGNVPDPEFTLDELKQQKIAELKTQYEYANCNDILYMNHVFQADKDSQDLIVSILSAGSVPGGFFWLDKDNVEVPMTYVDLQGLSGAILTRNQSNFVKYQSLKNQVLASTTESELATIVW